MHPVRIAGWSLFGLGAAGLLVGTAAMTVAVTQTSDGTSTSGLSGPWRAAIGAFAGGGAALIAGIVMVSVSPRTTSANSAAAPSVDLTPSGLRLRF